MTDIKDIIQMAISREVESYTFYRSVSDRVKDANLKDLFNELAGDETKHRQFLEGLLTKDVKDLHIAKANDYKVGDSLETPKLTMDLKPIDGLVLAIKKELEAMQMYTQLANSTSDFVQKSLFQNLAAMESGHKARLEDLYVEMAFPEKW
ncbi:ferritin family protein [Methanoregula sp.]|uniref:ferritin-like domain-containing protein n=1 Tax=Methanoregula sp. TaxID=2052170 RepID=UPI003564033E